MTDPAASVESPSAIGSGASADAGPTAARWLLAVVGGLVFACGMPGVLPFDELAPVLVLSGLMAWFALATASRRPLLASFVFGAVFMAISSWTVSYVLFAAYGAVVVLGGGYFVLATIAARTTLLRGPGWRIVAFAIATAGSFWLRAYMPEIYYPHGQPAHSLYCWPVLLGAVTLGGEVLVNALFAALAAALVELWRGWRVAEPPFAVARNRLLAVLAVGVAATGAGWSLQVEVETTDTLEVATLETGLHSLTVAAMPWAEYERMVLQSLMRPTAELLADPEPPALVLWPETAIPHVRLLPEELAAGRARVALPRGLPATKAQLLTGLLVGSPGEFTPAAALIELPSGLVLGHQEKRRIVPGGEFLPLSRVLPFGLGEAMLGLFESALGSVPDFRPGQARPLLAAPGGARFGVLMCYDNAYPELAREHVAAGARFLAVLSNETWFEGGAELQQLVAMSVCRALETGVPLLRCTTDGWTVVVGADGRLLADLGPAPLPTAGTRILRTKLGLGPAHEPPMPSWAAYLGPFTAFWLGLGLLHSLVRWARLRVARSAP
ncbi:MAG: apolipoprotein N-acyltransferase [bacterium]|nr:apolipoprotein N-acyltransferase [bacterium]